MPVAGGDSVEFAPPDNAHTLSLLSGSRQMTVDDEGLHFLSGDEQNVFTCSRETRRCSWRVLISSGVPVWGLASDPGAFYALMGLGADGIYIEPVTKAGVGQPAIFFNGTTAGRGLLRRGNRTYAVVEGSAGTDLIVHTDGVTALQTTHLPTSPLPSVSQEDPLAGDDSAIYIGHDKALFEVRDGAVKTLATFDVAATSVAIDDAYVYATLPGKLAPDQSLNLEGSVVAVPRAGGSPIVVAAGQREPRSLATASGAIYWVDRAAGRLLRAATP
jgi:hypothetical protein